MKPFLNTRLIAMLSGAMRAIGPLGLQLPEQPIPGRAAPSLSFYPRAAYNPDRFRDHEQRQADAAEKRARRLERNRRLLANGAVLPVRSAP